MRLPGVNDCVVPVAKVVDYLLSETHPSGRWKATFFKAMGFEQESWEILADALKEHAARHNVVREEPSPFGTRYVVEGTLTTPSGRSPWVRTVWFVAKNSREPRLATAYPVRAR